MIYRLPTADWVEKICCGVFSLSDPNRHLTPWASTPRKPIVAYAKSFWQLFIYLFLPPFHFFSSMEVFNGRSSQRCLSSCLSASSAIMPVDVRLSELNRYCVIVKDCGAFLMETCLHSPVGNLSHWQSPAGGGGCVGVGGWGRVGEGEERGLTWITLSYLPSGPPVNNPATVAFSFTLCLRRFLAPLFRHSSCHCISPQPFMSLPLTLSTAFTLPLFQHYKTNNSHLSRCTSRWLSFSLCGNLKGTALAIGPREIICLGNFWSDSKLK